MKMWLLQACWWCWIGFVAAAPALAETGRRGALVDPAWLTERLGRPGLVVIDASPPKLHAAGHIPGAVNVDVFGLFSRSPASTQMVERFRSLGINQDSTVVLLDQGGDWAAPRLFYDLFHHGFAPERLVLLDGGMARWKAAGGAMTTQPTTAPDRGNFEVQRMVADARVRLPEFLVASGDPARHALVDALEAPYHFGAAKFFDRAGHVPGAIHWPASDFFEADKRFKSPEEIRRMAAHLGITREHTVHAHCGGGGAAAVPFVALRFIAGFERVKLYQESQMEWLRDDRGLPFWTYSDPTLMRSAEWLAGWGAPFMHMMGLARLAVIDVRPEAAYTSGHLSQAVHLGADALKQPASLPERLGRAGVNPADEAVIVSDRGLTPEAALAFVHLQRLGQRRVSLLRTSVDDWALAGHPITKDIAALPPRAYAAQPRQGVVLTDATEAGLYPTVVVAMGKTPPAMQPSGQPVGKLVHLSAVELLQADGWPRPASELLKAFQHAGVPRYARIVTVAEEAGDAAIGYVLFKLMGYADVKVMLR
jgi:thiosulfate/3-mercaptopyruvate sulfurtransferase